MPAGAPNYYTYKTWRVGRLHAAEIAAGLAEDARGYSNYKPPVVRCAKIDKHLDFKRSITLLASPLLLWH